MDVIFFVGAFFLLLIVFFVLYKIIRSFTQVVPQEKRLVVYRLGRFHRIVGPGPVQVISGLDQVIRTIEVRDHPVEITVDGIFAFGVPNDFTLNLWYSTDLVKAAGGDKKKLANLVLLTDTERQAQVKVKMRDAVVKQLAALQKSNPLPQGSGVMEGVIALAPGSDRFNALLEGVKQDLQRSLPTIGVILNTDQPIVLTRRGLTADIIEAISRRRGREMDSEWLTDYANKIREKFPDVSMSVLTQLLASIEGVDIGKVQRLLLEQEPGSEVEVEFEMAGDGTGDAPNVITKPRSKRPRAAKFEAKAKPATHLSESDLSVLRRIPRREKNEPKSA